MANLMKTKTAHKFRKPPDPWIPADTFQTRLRLIRWDMGRLSAADAAEYCGLAPSTWSTWEKDGGATPRHQVEVINQICDATGVDRDWLMWGTRNRCFASSAEVSELTLFGRRFDDGGGVVEREDSTDHLSTQLTFNVIGPTAPRVAS